MFFFDVVLVRNQKQGLIEFDWLLDVFLCPPMECRSHVVLVLVYSVAFITAIYELRPILRIDHQRGVITKAYPKALQHLRKQSKARFENATAEDGGMSGNQLEWWKKQRELHDRVDLPDELEDAGRVGAV